MFGIGANELIIILLFGFLIFGPDKLPAMAKTIGRAIAKFRSAQQEMNNVIKNEVYDPNSDDPFKNPLDALSKVEERVTREDRGESFSERKARYDKRRAAQKAAQERKEAAKAKVETNEASADAADAEATETTEATKAATAGAASANSTKPSIDELYGVSKKARKPKAAEDKAVDSKAASKDNADSADSKVVKKKPSVVGKPVDKQADEALDEAIDKTSDKALDKASSKSAADVTKEGE